jgi:hypothetical protein
LKSLSVFTRPPSPPSHHPHRHPASLTVAPPPSQPPGLPHHRLASLTIARPPSPPPGRPHRCSVVPSLPPSRAGPATARLPPRVLGRPSPGPTAARCLPHSPCSVEPTASSMTSTGWSERALLQQPIASAQPERRPSWQRLPHNTPMPNLHCWPLTSIVGPIFLCSRAEALRYLCTSSFFTMIWNLRRMLLLDDYCLYWNL